MRIYSGEWILIIANQGRTPIGVVCRRYVRAYAGLLHQVVNGKDLKIATQETSKEMGFDVHRATQVFTKDTDAVSQLGSACYINGAFKVIMYFAYKVRVLPL